MMSTHTRIAGLNKAGRDLVVGDVHGCFRTLDRALSELDFDSGVDRLFGVGDLVNRGPYSDEALAWLEDRFDAVTLGNHERPVRDWFRAKVLDLGSALLTGFARSRVLTISAGCVSLTICLSPSPSRLRTGSSASSTRRCRIRIGAGRGRCSRPASRRFTDVALLGFENAEQEARARARPVEGVRALVHGHWSVAEVESTLNRWNIDTGAGLKVLNRLSLLEVNGPQLRSWTFEVDDF